MSPARLLALALLVSTAPGLTQVVDGDFEREGSPAWRRFGRGVEVRRVEPPGWLRYGSRFSSRDYTALRLYLRIQSGTGSVWFDAPAIGGLPLANASLEEADGNRVPGWGQDNVGETIFSSDQDATDGGRAVLLRQVQEGTSRIWQEVACQPGQEYEASVWMRPAGFQGDAYAEIYGMRDGKHGDILWQSDHVSGAFGVQLGRASLRLRGRAESAGGIEQSVRVGPGRNLVLSAALAVPRVEGGQVKVSAWAGQEPLGEIALGQAQPRWETLHTIFQSPESGRVTIRAEVQGDALAYVDNVLVAEPSEAVAAAKAQFLETERNLVLPPRIAVRLGEPSSDLLRKGVAILSRKLSEATRGQVRVEYGEGDPALEVGVEPPPGGAALAWPDTESYVLSCSAAGVRLSAPTEVGAFYGLMSLPDLLDLRPDGRWHLIAARLDDAPQLPFRGTYMADLPRDRAQRIAWCERLAALRLNAVVFEDDIWWKLDNETARRTAQEAFADFRSYGLEPIPELQSFGWAGIILAIDPMCAEGAWVEREDLTLIGEEPARLFHPNVLRTKATDIVVRDEKDRVYEEGRDYLVINGETRHVYRPDAKPYYLQRTADSRLPDGATVRVSYDYVSRVNSENCPYCPSEPLTAEIMTAAIRNTVRYLAPRYVHIGHDEPAQMNTDSRCRRRRVTNARLLAEDVKRLDDAAHEIDPNVRLMMWEDAVNPYHNGLQFTEDPTSEAIHLLPKSVIQNVWFYGADQPPKVGADSLRYFAAHGFTTTGSPWDDPTCATGWAQACLAARQRGEDCLGVLYTSWGDRWGALETFARSAWRVPPLTPGRETAAKP